jgi:hypothetical protein
MHSFDPEIAKLVGVNAAVIHQNIIWWTQKNAANGRHCYDGRYWTYNSIAAFDELFPYLTRAQIRSALLKLEEAGLIVCGNYNKSAYDRTKWYSPNEQLHLSKLANGFERDDQPIPDDKPVGKPDKDMSSGDDERVYNFANNNLEPSLQPEHVVEVWNAMAERTGLPRVRRLTDARRKQLKARIRENTLDEWTEAIAAIERSDFCRGEKTSWRADFDFLLQPKSFTKLIEGAYDGRS